MSEDNDWADPNVIIRNIAEVIWPTDTDEDTDIFDDFEQIAWLINKHFDANK
jgi:hypothetical protein